MDACPSMRPASQALCAHGYQVVALARPTADAATCKRLSSYGATLFNCDVSKPTTLTGAAVGAAAVVSCLGSRRPTIPDDLYRVDKQAQVNVYNMAAQAGVPLVVAIGSFEGPETRSITDLSR